MITNFPDAPAVGQVFARTGGGPAWQFDGTKWAAASALGGTVPTFDAFPGVVGDGAHDDTVGMQAAIDATAGGTIAGTPGKTYLVTGALYLPSRTKCVGQGATVSFPVTVTGDTIRAMFVVGLKGPNNGIPDGDELKAVDVEISGWRFFSPTGGKGQAAIIAQPGSERVMIRHNHFESDYFIYLGALAPPVFTAVFLSKKRLRDIVVDSNTFYKMGRFILVRGSETQTGTPYYYDVKGSTSVTEVVPGSAGPAAAGTTYFMVPTTPADGTTISPLARMLPPHNWRWGVVIVHTGHPFDSYRLYSAVEGGNDMAFNGVDRVTIDAHIGALPTDPDWVTRFFVWDPDVDPADDLNGLTITNNRGNHTAAGPIALFCQILAGRKGAVPEADGLRNVVIDNNRLAFNYLPGGNIANIAFDSDEDPALTNFALWSEDFSNAGWTKTNLTAAAGYWGPRYDTTRPAASRLSESAATGVHGVSEPVTLSNATNPWTASIFLQAGTRSTARLTWQTLAGVGGYVDVDLVLGTIVGSGAVGGGAVNFSGVIPYGDGWWRVYLDCNILSTSAIFALNLTNGTGVTSYAGAPTNYLQAFGLQVEQQASVGNRFFFRNCTPSSYKPTHDQPALEISTAVIAINGTVGFACTNNIIAASVGQGIHIEDGSSNGVIAHNHISECTFGMQLMDCHNIAVVDNTVTRFYKQGITLRGGAPTTHNYGSTQWVDFQGSISGTTLTVTSINNYPTANLLANSAGIYKNLVSYGSYTGDVRPGTRILSQLTGTAGSTGTYTVSKSQTVTLPTPLGKTTLSAGFGGQTDNLVVTGNMLDAVLFPSVQAGYWIEAAYDPFIAVIDNPPTLGLPTAGTAAADVYASADYDFRPLLSADRYARPIAVANLGTASAAKAGQRRTVNDAAAPTYRGALTAGGANVVSAICTGSAWVAE
jgi:hypothetical protein